MVEYNCIVKIFVLTLSVISTNGFNLSPIPNIILKEPSLKILLPKYQSSYFGFTIVLRNSSVFVAAPRAQSSHDSQRKINETGVIYRCYFARSDGSGGNCKPFFFDREGDVNSENDDVDDYPSYDTERKSHQWLGASMDGSSNDSDPLVVCAPKLAGQVDIEIFMNGICYWTSHTKNHEPFQIKEITALRLKINQIIYKPNAPQTINHIYGEQGFSVHITKNNEEFIIGAPGVRTWMGSVIRYNLLNSTAEVLNPNLWNQGNDSYFGYSVASGYFNSELPEKIYYVASAPQANRPLGEVYIFDMIVKEDDHNIEKKYIFVGSNVGEYFGYAVLAEDLNGDGLTDLIITAPQYSSDGRVERGAIYVFTNKKEFFFERKSIISPVEGNGRFGTSISKLGDINGDGYNDVAVGAPFAGNGIVFIYLGSPKGLVHSQQLSPGPIETFWGSAMFGHSFSNGADIDNNGFNDFAIGAPNAESVFVYYAYPIVKIHTIINSTDEIAIDQKTFPIEICYRFSTKSKTKQSQNISIRFEVDTRVKLQQTNSSEWTSGTVTALKKFNCISLDANVNFVMRNISQNIELKMQYNLTDGIPKSKKFCDKCATLDPADTNFIVKKIPFNTGCASNPCSVDLKVTSSGVSPSYLLGGSNTISVTYEVTNFNENAYNPQITVTSSNKMPFYNIPPYCKQIKDELSCDLNPAQLMLANSKENITITYDTTDIEGTSMNLTAFVFCTGTDKNQSDNSVIDVITFREFTDIEVVWKTNTTNINIEENFNSSEIILIYEVKSIGGSKIQELEIVFDIPIAHKFNGTTQPIHIIDFNRITSIQGLYNGQKLGVELLRNETESKTRTMAKQIEKLVINQPSKIDAVEMENYSKTAYTRISPRSRRSTEQVVPSNEYSTEAQKNAFEVLSKNQKSSLASTNRTIIFTCMDPEMTTCERVVMKVKHFKRNTTIDITLKYNVSLTEVNKTLVQPWEFFAIITKLNIVKVGDSTGKTINITRTMESIDVVISKYQLFDVSIPWKVIISSIIGGLLILAAISYAMYKSNFFKRKTKEDMEKLVQEKQEKEQWEEEKANILEKQQEGEGIEDAECPRLNIIEVERESDALV